MSLWENTDILQWWKKDNEYSRHAWLSGNKTSNEATTVGWFNVSTYRHTKDIESNNYIWDKQPDFDNKPIINSYKLRLNPSREQREILEKWAGCARYTYNATVAALKNSDNSHRTWQKLRDRYVTQKKRSGSINNYFDNKPWLGDTPPHIRVNAVKEAVKNRKAAFTNLRNGNIQHFDLGFKTKKSQKSNGWVIEFDKSNVKRKRDALHMFPKKLGEMRYRSRKQLHKFMPNERPEHDVKIIRDRYGDYYLVLAVTKEVKPLKKEHTRVTSCDPGVSKRG